MMTPSLIWEVLSEVSYPGLDYRLVPKGEVLFLQIHCHGTDNVTGDVMTWNSRKWYMSPHMTRSEIIQTAFLATLTALEHEAREKFKYRGVTVLDPHLDLDNLVLVKSERVPA